MKRVVGLLAFVFLLNGCDDGNVIFEEIAFANPEVKSCSTNNIFYKLKEKEALLLEMDKTELPSEPTLTDAPKIIDISGATRVVYRFYNGTVALDNICETIQPPTPVVTDQWTATAGKIEITTTAKKTTNTTDNSTKITGYNHHIEFQNITFSKSSGPQKYINFPFGDYSTTATPLPFAFDKTVEKCSSSNLIYNYTGSEALTLIIDPALIANTVTPQNAPRIGLIGAITNKLSYRLYSGIPTTDYFCSEPTPATPAISQEWNALAGVSNESGIVEVTTTTNGTGFKHTIVLKKVTFKRGNNDFKLGDNYLYGELLTTN